MNSVAVNKQQKIRELIINGNLFKAIFTVTIPLILYNFCNYLYGIYDTVVVSSSGIGSVDSIVFLDQVKSMISTLGSSFAVGGAIIIARKYGAGFYQESRKTANNLFYSSLIISFAVILIFIPFGIPFLKLLSTPQEFITHSIDYFYIQILILAVVFMNNTFIAIEKSKGNTKNIMLFNIAVVLIKVALTTWFVYGGFKNVTVTWVAYATLIAQLFMLIGGMFILFNKNNILKISFQYVKSLSWIIIKPIIVVSLPIFIGKFLFSFGKVFVNIEATAFYGVSAVGALGISNTIAGAITNLTGSIEDGASTIVSQNVGNNNDKRAISAFKKVLIICIAVSTVGTILISLYSKELSQFFAPNDIFKQEMIQKINYYERFSIILLGIEAASLGLLYGYGKTKAPMVISMMRLFAFRIPPLLFMYHIMQINYESTGIAMMISNALTGIIGISVALMFIVKRKKNPIEILS